MTKRSFSVAIWSVLIAAHAAAPLLAGAPASTQSDSSTAPTAASAVEFDQARRLMQQGQFDDALAALHKIEAKRPATKGLAHEFGVAYYKKADYPNAITYLKNAHDENTADGEAV